MTIRDLTTEPAAILSAVAHEAPIMPSLRVLVSDMIDTMRAHDGVGLAAPQVGEPLRVIVVDWGALRGGESLPVALVNPVIAWRSEKTDVCEEGCLSVPGIAVDVTRSTSLRFEAQTEDGREFNGVAYGMLARAIQHEVDHLDGVTLLRTPNTVPRAPRKVRR